MSTYRVVALLAALSLAGHVSAQADRLGSVAAPPSSLEQDYANLCANRPEPASETCVALKKALVSKLTASAPVPLHASAPDPVELAKQEAARLRFGLFAEMVGKTYFGSFDNGSYPFVAEYSWEMPGESIVVTLHGATPTGDITSDADCGPTKVFRRFKESTGQLVRTIAKPCWPQLPAAEVNIQADGSIIETELKGKYRDVVKRRRDGTFRNSRQERKRSGAWEPLGFGSTTLHERTPEFLASLRAEQRRAASRRDESNSGLGGAIIRGLAMGVSGVEAPLMNEDGSEVNTLQVLNAAGAELARQNAQVHSPSSGAIIVDNTPAPTYTPPPASSAPPQTPAQPAFQPSKPTQSQCSYWHRPRASDREYEQCSPGDENCTCADAAKVSNQ